MIISLAYLFSRNNKIGSRLISWGTKSLASTKIVPSHVALLINNKWVFESTLSTGIRIISYQKWLEINEEVRKIPCQSKRTYGEIKTLFKALEGRSYDYLGVIYFGWRIFLNMLFKLDMPKVNHWQSKNKYFCTEVVGKLLNIDYGMISPVQLMEYLDEFETKKSV